MDYDGVDVELIPMEELVERMNTLWNSIHEHFVPVLGDEVDNFQEFDALMLALSKKMR